MDPSVKKRLPNLLTLARLVLAAAFFVVLTRVDPADLSAPVLNLAAGIFIIAALTDMLDGYLARKWNATSTFGRIMDPVCDKVLVLGGFIFLAGPGFAVFPASGDGSHFQITGVMPWMVVVILTREFLVTGIRSLIESRGHAFGAGWSGKIKMIVQSVAVPTILILIAEFDPQNTPWASGLQTFLVHGTVGLTVLSVFPYLKRAHLILDGASGTAAPEKAGKEDSCSGI